MLKKLGWILMAGVMLCSASATAQTHYATKQAQESYDNGIKLERRAEEKNDNAYLKEAAAAYRQAIAAEPNMAQAYVRLGYVLYALGESVEGERLLRDALGRHPDNIELKHYLGLNLYQNDRMEEAERLLLEVVGQRQDLPEAYFILGKINLDKGDAIKAQEYFTLYASATPNDVHAYRALAAAYIQARDVAGAESSLARLLELAPDDIVAKINMGHVKYERGQIDEAVRLYEQAYKADPRRTELLYIIASAYYLSGNYEEAIARFDKVLESDETHMGAQYFQADACLKLGRLDEAEKRFKALETHMPDYHYIKLKLAYIRMLRGDSDAADEVRRLMKETKNADDLHFGAVVLRKQGNVDESIAVHKQLRDANPGNNLYGVYLARELIAAHEYNQANDILMSIIDESVNDSLAWEMLSLTMLHQGMDAMMMGEFDNARALFEQALSMDVHVIEAYCNFSQLSMLEGNQDEAYRSFQAAEQLDASHPLVVKLAAQFDIMDGKYDAARKRLENVALSQSPDALGGSGWYLLAVAQSWTGQWEGAEASLKNAERLGVSDSPASSVVALQSAMKHYAESNYEALGKDLLRVEKYKEGLDDVDLVRFEYLTAVQAIRDKKFSVARSALESVQDIFSGLPGESRRFITQDGTLDISFELAYVYYETGNLENALSLLSGQNSASSKSLEAAVRRKLGYQALKSKKYEFAIDNYNRLNALGNLSSADQYNAILARLQARRLENADNVLGQYAKQNIPEAVLNYAIYLDGAGNGARATQFYEKYVSMASARKSEEVRRVLAVKQRVWGSSR